MVELPKKELFRDNRFFRLDSEFYLKKYIEYQSKIEKISNIRLNESASIDRGVTPKKYGDYQHPVIRSGDLTPNFPIKENLLKTKAEFLYRIHPNDILISSIGKGSIGKVRLFLETDCSYSTVSEVTVLRNAKINPFYLSFYLQTKFGQAFIEKNITGSSGQLHLNTGNIQDIIVPLFSPEFYRMLENVYRKSYNFNITSKSKYKSLEPYLLECLGLSKFIPSRQNINVKTLKNSFISSGRFDAEYYQPKYDQLEKLLKNGSSKSVVIKDIAESNFRGLQPIYDDLGTLDVINSKHILDDHLDYNNFEKTNQQRWFDQAKARVYKGDILTYTTGANIGRTNVYSLEDKALASNHVNILRLNSCNSSYVGFVMNSIIGRLQTEKYSTGSAQAELYPKDIDEFLIPLIDEKHQDYIVTSLNESLSLKTDSSSMIQIGKEAVEIAIEDNELAAVEYLMSRK